MNKIKYYSISDEVCAWFQFCFTMLKCITVTDSFQIYTDDLSVALANHDITQLSTNHVFNSRIISQLKKKIRLMVHNINNSFQCGIIETCIYHNPSRRQEIKSHVWTTHGRHCMHKTTSNSYLLFRWCPYARFWFCYDYFFMVEISRGELIRSYAGC